MVVWEGRIEESGVWILVGGGERISEDIRADSIRQI